MTSPSTSPGYDPNQLAFEREKWEAELELRRSEIALKREELNRSRLFNPLTLAVIAAAVAAIGNFVVTWINSHEQRRLEWDRAEITRGINKEQSQATLNLEKQIRGG
jgi:hypothetical protein